MKGIRETLLGTLVHGKETLQEIEVLRRTTDDRITGDLVGPCVGRLHPKTLRLVVSWTQDTGRGARIIRLAPEDGWLPPFEAGQFLNVFTVIDGVRTSRPYSICSSPTERAYYEITVARVQDGFVSDHLIDAVQVGDRLEASSPSGVFHYNPVFHSRKSLFLAGGSGITPFLSMTREALETRADRDIVLIYGIRNEAAALYGAELEDWAARCPNFRFVPVASEPTPGWKGETGFIGADLIARLVPDHAERTAYVCGPEVMNEFCVAELGKLGFPARRIRREMFGASKDVTREPGWPEGLAGDRKFALTVETASGTRTFPVLAGDSILTSLEKNGVRVNVCCRSGECSLCRVRLVSGNVFLSKGMLRRKADERFGYVHSCKSYPISDVSVAL